MMDLGIPEILAPPSLKLASGCKETMVRAAVSSLDPLGHLGDDSEPVFLSLGWDSFPADRVLYLGLTRESERWLTEMAGADFAQQRRQQLSLLLRHSGEGCLPDDPIQQVVVAVSAMTRWMPEAILTLAVMPLGLGEGSGCGLAFSCDPKSGESVLSGSFRADCIGAQLLARGGNELTRVTETQPWGETLAGFLFTAQWRARRPVRAEFVVERGRLWVLAVSYTGFSGAALIRAMRMLGRKGQVTARDALRVVSETAVAEALACGSEGVDLPLIASGLGVAPGIASGVAVFSAAEAVTARTAGKSPVLILPESRPEDLPGLLAACAMVTVRGGRTSHAGVVARSLGHPCVMALRNAHVDTAKRRLALADGRWISVDDEITVDGFGGQVYRGGLGRHVSEPAARSAEITGSLGWLLSGAADLPCIGVRVNADAAADAIRGRDAGAEGVGLCRIEHMFLGKRQQLLERALLMSRGPAASNALDALRSVLRNEFTAILRAMSGLPVAIRLLDPPRHEFLPGLTESTAPTAEAAGGKWVEAERIAATQRLRERNAMLGVRGVRLGILEPALTRVQVQALAESVVALRRTGYDPRPELLVPMVSIPTEVSAIRRILIDECDRIGLTKEQFEIPLGVMIETPRAALAARDLTTDADFFSLGTNDLTALVWGLSRDDAETELIPSYVDQGVLANSPFERLDIAGVGELITRLVRDAREARPDLPIGACGEHAAEVEAVQFFAEIGINYVSCVPPSVPIARFAAARFAISKDNPGAMRVGGVRT